MPLLEQELGENLALSIVQKMVEHGGLLLTGPAGVGKTWLIHEILRLLKETSPDQKQIIAALRHCAAMLVGGKTIQHYLCKYRKNGGSPKPGTYVVLDECSEIQMHTWSLLAQWKLMGVRFIILGDFDGQLPPIFDKWANAMERLDIRASQFLYDLVGGLHIKLTTYRRGTDPELFRRYVMLYRYADLKPARARGRFNEDYYITQQIVEKTRETYPMHDGEVDIHFCRTHKQRMEINDLVNKIEASKRDDVLLLPCRGCIQGAQMQPQTMCVWVGMELLCYTRKYKPNFPVNGGVYVVRSFDSEKVVVRLHEDYRRYLENKEAAKELEVDEEAEEGSDAESDPEDMGADEEDDEECAPPPAKKARKEPREPGVYSLTHRQAMMYLRPQHALVYASIQGRTLRDKHIALLDWQSHLFTPRHLIVAISRATHGKFVHVLNHDEEQGLLRDYKKRVREIEE